jgi:hypothetical protein
MGPKRDILGEMFVSVRKLGMKTIATIHEHPGSIFGIDRVACRSTNDDVKWQIPVFRRRHSKWYRPKDSAGG